MKTQIETINGRLCTVIRRPFDADKVRESLAMGVPVIVEGDFNKHKLRYEDDCNQLLLIKDLTTDNNHPQFLPSNRSAVWGRDLTTALTILPALPRYPTATQIAKYAAEGIYLRATIWEEFYEKPVEEDASVVVMEGQIRYDAGYAKFFNVEECGCCAEITHAVDRGNNRVKVAIYGA